MLILLDNNAPRGLVRALASHSVTEARERGWATLKNDELLLVAEQAGFDVLLIADKNIRYQQNLKEHTIAIVVRPNSGGALYRSSCPKSQQP